MVAFAAWTATGTGSGEVKALTAVNLLVEAETPSGCLYPTGPTCPVQYKVTNNNPYKVELDTLTLGAITAVSGGLGAGCDAPTDTHGVTADTTPTAIAGDPVVNGGGGTVTLSSAALVTMANTSHNDCQGAVFTIAATVAGHSTS